MRGALAQRAEIAEESEGARVIPLPDRALLERHVRGDPSAFAALVEAWQGPVYGYLARSGVAGAERDDLFQDVFLRIHRGLAEGLPPGPTGPWIFAIAVNAVRSHFRKARVRAVVTLSEDPAATAAHDAPSPERALALRQTTAWALEEIAKLPLEQREALLLCTVHGLELRDAADALGVPAETVKTRLRRARIALAEARARRSLREEREGVR
ncbi:MAG: RNA polymerase sigma factor [Myxococcota bacterium]|nr:RNA polymerase sigma factor [Myxococcota bacterium]